MANMEHFQTVFVCAIGTTIHKPKTIQFSAEKRSLPTKSKIHFHENTFGDANFQFRIIAKF